jgi:hypothetical protein
MLFDVLLALKLEISRVNLPKREPDSVVYVAKDKDHRGSGRDKDDSGKA